MPDQPKDSFSVLFVCAGNLCRSPMAEILLKHFLARKYPPAEALKWHIESAGTVARIGEPATLGAQSAMAHRGLTLINHRSQRVNEKLLAKFKLVLVMEAGQKEALQAEFPRYARNIYLLSEMAGINRDVADPIGRNIADYDATAGEIYGYIERGFEKIYQLGK